MGKITTINSQTNYRNNLKVVPFEKTIIDNYFSKIDQVWEYAPDVEMVEIQKDFGSEEYYPYKMRVERFTLSLLTKNVYIQNSNIYIIISDSTLLSLLIV